MRIPEPRNLSKSYVDQREAMRKGRNRKQWSEHERKRLAKIERDIELFEEEERRKRIAKANQPQGRQWWQFWKRGKSTTEGWS